MEDFTISQYMQAEVGCMTAMESLNSTARELTEFCDAVSNVFDLQRVADQFQSTECLKVIHALTEGKLIGYSAEGFLGDVLNRIMDFLRMIGRKLADLFQWLGTKFRMLFHGGYDPKAFTPFDANILSTYVDEELTKTFADVQEITDKYIQELKKDPTGSALTDFSKDKIEKSLKELNEDIEDRKSMVHFATFDAAIKAKKELEKRAKNMSVMRKKMESIQKAVMNSAKIVQGNMKNVLSKDNEANTKKITEKMNILSKACGDEVTAFTKYANAIIRCTTVMHTNLKK